MDLSEFRSLDFNDLPRAPASVKAVLLLTLFLAIIGLGYYLDWSTGLEELDKMRAEETSLRDGYSERKRQATYYEEHKRRLEETEQALKALLKQLPSKAEMDALLMDINQAGVGRGLTFELFRPGGESLADSYATLPVTIKVTGTFHDLAGFVSDVAQMPRIVTLHDISLLPGKDAVLTMDATVRTYRDLDENEVTARQKAQKGKKS